MKKRDVSILEKKIIMDRYGSYFILKNVVTFSEMKIFINSLKYYDLKTIFSEVENFFLSKGVSRQELGESLEVYSGYPYFRFLSNSQIRPDELMKNLKKPFLEEACWLPIIEKSKNSVVVVSFDPNSNEKSNGLLPQFVFKNKIEWRITTVEEYCNYFDFLFGKKESTYVLKEDIEDISSLIYKFTGCDEDSDNSDNSDNSDVEVFEEEDNEVVQLVNKIFIDAYKMGASDIHIEPRLKSKSEKDHSHILIRYRIDGVLQNYTKIPWKYRQSLISRIKIMANIDISEKRRPQDGKIKMKAPNNIEFELRVAVCPSVNDNEDIVLRILASSKPLPIDEMNFSDINLEKIKEVISKPYGLFYVCGPTGSGKTTTLHSILGYLNSPETKIWTAEDPVEITQEGLRQVQINRKAGIDFATILKSFLRLDPDIIMIGESRDVETVSAGIEASLTGHLVFSTLHTNSAPESVVRLLDMGMEAFNFADAILGILAQRLARKLCKECKEKHIPNELEINRLLYDYCNELKNTTAFKNYDEAVLNTHLEWIKQYGDGEKIITFKAKKGGCAACSHTGYKGRMALHEFLIGTEEVKYAIQKKARPQEIAQIANEYAHFRTLKQDGIIKILKGFIDYHELKKVCIK